uniref:Uncharacterized protein n=1 Tax=Strombidium inclinatum TaxID=197538 RepID=A0A7S3IJ66_9SPIT
MRHLHLLNEVQGFDDLPLEVLAIDPQLVERRPAIASLFCDLLLDLLESFMDGGEAFHNFLCEHLHFLFDLWRSMINLDLLHLLAEGICPRELFSLEGGELLLDRARVSNLVSQV